MGLYRAKIYRALFVVLSFRVPKESGKEVAKLARETAHC
jgi:hypothetical protein